MLFFRKILRTYYMNDPYLFLSRNLFLFSSGETSSDFLFFVAPVSPAAIFCWMSSDNTISLYFPWLDCDTMLTRTPLIILFSTPLLFCWIITSFSFYKCFASKISYVHLRCNSDIEKTGEQLKYFLTELIYKGFRIIVLQNA